MFHYVFACMYVCACMCVYVNILLTILVRFVIRFSVLLDFKTQTHISTKTGNEVQYQCYTTPTGVYDSIAWTSNIICLMKMF